jgi:hypothetical protein
MLRAIEGRRRKAAGALSWPGLREQAGGDNLGLLPLFAPQRMRRFGSLAPANPLSVVSLPGIWEHILAGSAFCKDILAASADLHEASYLL